MPWPWRPRWGFGPRAHAQYDVIVTPDQFIAQDPWSNNLFKDTVDAYQGDNSHGYYWTSNYFPYSPSGTIKIPLPAGMPSGWHQYAVCEWDPKVHSQQFFVVDIAADGTVSNTIHAGEPWAGNAGTNQQWLQNDQGNQANLGGWLQLGPGPQSDSSSDNAYGGASGYGVWMSPDTGNGYPYLYIHLDGNWETSPESFDAFHVVQIDGPTWNLDFDGPWSISGFWSTGIAPNAPGAVANFLHASTSPRTVTVNQPVTVGLMNFSNTNGYTLLAPTAAATTLR